MASTSNPGSGPDGAQHQAPKPRPPNPVFRAMGLPNFRLRLPSRNWMIFLSITGSIAAAISYDRRQKKVNQRKWCDLVAHIAQEPLAVTEMPRKLTIFLSAPPGDGIRPSREYFKQYVKPILVAAAIDYDVIEGRKEGEVRYGTAEKIRRIRRKRGEKGANDDMEVLDTDQAIQIVREKMGIRPEPGVAGDLVVGRHTWKEYIRGLHEGWLGPLDDPTPPIEVTPEPSTDPTPLIQATSEPSTDPTPSEFSSDSPTPPPSDDENVSSSSEAAPKAEETPKEVKEEKKPPSTPKAYISTTQYSSAPLTSTIPQYLEASAPIPHLHLLGFLKTPVRIYRFFTQRYLADDIGRRTAAIVLASSRPYQQSESFASTSTSNVDSDPTPIATRAPENDNIDDPAAVTQPSQTWEQQSLLADEEQIWHKSARRPRTDDLERVWLNEMVIDARIGERMRKFDLDAEEDDRARRIGEGVEKGRAQEVADLRKLKPILEDLKHMD